MWALPLRERGRPESLISAKKLALLREGDTSILESMTVSVSDEIDSETASESDRDLRDDVRQLISLGARSGFHVMLVAEK